MTKIHTPGLYRRGKYWYIDKQVFGVRLCQTTKTSSRTKAEICLAKFIEDRRQEYLFGVRKKRTFAEAAKKYLTEYKDRKSSIKNDKYHVKLLNSYFGDVDISKINNSSLQNLIADRLKAGRKKNTINTSINICRRILNLAATEWFDDKGMTWLATAPKLPLLTVDDDRKPYPFSFTEQEWLFKFLPNHLKQMILFKINSGTREQEVCKLRWKWECKLPELNTSVFIIPGKLVKNKIDRLVVLNDIAKQVIEEQRGKNSEFVFVYNNKPVRRMNNTAWKNARKKAGLKHIRIHDCRHVFGRRLRSSGVNFEDRQNLLGHKSIKGITTHYCVAEIQNLIDAANKVCNGKQHDTPTLTLLKAASYNEV